MTLLWCLCGLTTAFCIGRYNKSNKLFWTLFTSFVIGIAGAAVYNKYVQHNRSEVRTTQVILTQENPATNNYVTFDADLAVCNNLPALVSRNMIPEYRSNIIGTQWVNQPIIPPPQIA